MAVFNKYITLSFQKNIYLLENKNINVKRFKELKKALLEQKYSKSLIEPRIFKPKEIPLKVFRQQKTTKHGEIIPLINTYNPNNPNIFFNNKA